MLVQIHMIQNHAPSNLNRDDTGSPKEAIFGGVARARISSQCLKRSIRQSRVFQEAMGGRLGVRTRRFPHELHDILLDLGTEEDAAAAITRMAVTLFFRREKTTDRDSDEKDADSFGSEEETGQLVFYGHDDVQLLAEQLRDQYESAPELFSAKGTAKEREKRRRQLEAKLYRRKVMGCPVDIALFGRMTTTSLFDDVQASAQVAHAISTTRVDHQFDYFTAVDDLKTDDEEDRGAGMIGDVEFNSATYYKYFAIDVDALIANLGGEAEVAQQAAAAFLKAAALTTPTGKQNTFAAHNPPDAILLEVSASHVPVNYANAFVGPVRATSDSDVVAASVKRLSEYSADLNRAYGMEREAFALTTRGMTIEEARPVESLAALSEALTKSFTSYVS